MGRPLVDSAFYVMLGALALLAVVAWWRGGPALVTEGLRGGGSLLVRFSLVLVVSFLAAGLVEVVVPREWVARALGHDSGFVGILLGTAAGVVTPAGPFVSMPLAAVFIRSGAAPGPVVAFLTGWALLALHRLIAWEIPILGPRFALFRFLVSLALPVLAGLLARWASRA